VYGRLCPRSFPSLKNVYAQDEVSDLHFAAPLQAVPLPIHFSDSHRHDDVAVFVVVAFGGPELAGGLGIFQF
jgi:hypothetical protein